MIKMVIVDDYRETAETLSLLYESIGNVEIVGLAQDSEQLWEIVADKKVDFISLDIQLKEENGLGICEMFHKRYPDVFIVMCSVEATEENKRRAKEMGASHFLAKPISMNDVFEVLALCSNRKTSLSMDNAPLTSEGLDRLFEDL